jgi:hypothetical protein
MTLLFFVFQLSVPIFLKWTLYRTAAPFYVRAFSLLQDLLIVFLLFSCLSISVLLTCLLAFFVHFFLIVDAFLYREMKLRLQWKHVSYLRNISHLISSIKEMKFSLFLAVVFFFFVGHTASYFLYQSIEVTFSKISLIFLILAACTTFFIPRSMAYHTFHPFFLKTFSPVKLESLLQTPITTQNFSIPIDPKKPPHIVFLFLESFPAKYVGTNATPQFNQWRQKGIYFSQMYANGTLTYRAYLNALFGIPPKNTAVGLAPYVDVPFQGIPEVLKTKGYKTAFHHNGDLGFDLQNRFLEKHFDELSDKQAMKAPLSSHTSWGVPDEYLMRYSIDWLSQQNEPTFLTLFTLSNHHPWIVPEGYLSSQKSRFLQTLEYTDFCLGLFIKQLHEKNLSQNTLLFILGDHGQPQGEHEGNFYNSRFLYEENVHIPCLILAEGKMKPLVVDQIGSHLDLFPTLLDLMGEKKECLGTSLFKSCPDKTVFLQNPYSEGFIGCRKGKWKAIENCFSLKGELYDLEKDPKETKNLVETYPDIFESLQKKMYSFFSHVETLYESPADVKFASNCLDLSNSFLKDKELEALACLSLRHVNLENCLLLTSFGLSNFLSKSPSLEELNLKGASDLDDSAFPSIYPFIKKLDLSDAFHVTSEKLLMSFPYLQELSFNIKNGKRLPFSRLITLKLLDAYEITDEEIMAFLKRNPNLISLKIYGCTKITDRTLFFLKNYPLDVLWLFDAPLITKEGIDAISSDSFRSFQIN